MFNRLMVAFDGTEPSRRALHAGIDLARRLGTSLWAVTVLEDNPIYIAGGAVAPEVSGEIRRAAEAFAEDLRLEATREAATAGVELCFESVFGQEVEGIVEAVRRHRIDTLIVGIRAHPGLVDRLVSHTARDLSERSPCSIVGVK